VELNCEHFSSWCKTGSTESSQVSTFYASLQKIAVTIGLRLVALVILFLIQYSHEKFENEVKHRQQYEDVERKLTCAYIVIVTIIFTIHLVTTSGKRLPADPHSEKFHTKNPCSCAECDRNNSDESLCRRCWTCCVCTCCSFFCKSVLGLFTHCKQCCYQCYCCCCCFYCCTCCGRPGNLACGLFCRIFLREIPGLLGTVFIVVNEDTLTYNIQYSPPVVRTLVITLCIIAVQLAGYIVGALLGRWVEACCECSSWKTKPCWDEEPSKPSNLHEMSTQHTPAPV